MNSKIESLINGVIEGDRLIIGKVISLIENGEEDGFKILKKSFHLRKKTFILGITGPLGVGKSTLIDKILLSFEDEKIACLLCDPSSPISGGAFLGDRLRMKSKSENFFIRSMATRNFPFGISPSLPFVLDLLSISPYRSIFVETAGIGQGDSSIKNFSHLTIVLLAPYLGDEIQFLKGGIMEIGDMFVVTKGDYESAEIFYTSLKASFNFYFKEAPETFLVSAINGTGIEEVVNYIKRKREEILDSEIYVKREKIRRRETFKYLIRERFLNKYIQKLEDEKLKKIEEGEFNIYELEIESN
ncbi:MAG: GTP-binding protein [Caldisericia bacterium]|jgi:LAO/AO transport system kinase|nr:GTP-binding protein [Caldisericia bacterium]